MIWDKVYTVNDYFDGPRLGVADVDGVPHIFEADFDQAADEYSGMYFVSPIDEGLLALVLEDWEIWSRWEAAFKRGAVSIDSHPTLSQDRERHEALKVAIGGRLKVDRAHAKLFKADFRAASHDGATLVKWRTARS